MRRLVTILIFLPLVAVGTVFGWVDSSSPNTTGMAPAARDEPVRWGGEGIILTVSKNSVSMQFGCARASIPGGLKTSKGKFNVNGTYTPSTSIVSAEKPKPIAIGAEGRITGKRMTLKLTSLDTGKEIGTYTLERGKAIALSRCR